MGLYFDACILMHEKVPPHRFPAESVRGADTPRAREQAHQQAEEPRRRPQVAAIAK